MADQPAPTALDHAKAMLDHLQAQRPGDGHDLARAMVVSAALYLQATFGRDHALQTVADLLRPTLAIEEVPELLPGEAPQAAGSGAMLH